MTDEELKKCIAEVLDSRAAMAMTAAATAYEEEHKLSPASIGIALLIASFGVLSTEMTEEQIDEVFAFVKRATSLLRQVVTERNKT